MAHEITSKDQVILHKNAAWHGLGILVEDAPSPREAARIVFPWTVEPMPLFLEVGDSDEEKQLEEVEGWQMNVRIESDGTRGEQLGLVSSAYKVIQPSDVADFCEALVENGDTKVKIETAGSVRGGRRMWMLLKGEAFEVANHDEVRPYVCVSNGYDGTSSFRVTPTTVRVVCSNTLHAVIPQFDEKALGPASLSVRHTVNAMERVNQAKSALANYGKAIEETKKVIDTLSNKQVTSDEVKQFFLESYQIDFEEIPSNPKDKYEANRRERGLSALQSFSKRFDDERNLAGTTWWNVLNSYTGMCQHDKKATGKTDQVRLENRVESNLFGLNAERTMRAAQRAFKCAMS